MSFTRLVASILAIVALQACDDGETTTAPGPDASTTPSSTLTPWSSGSGTGSVPTYDKSCRFGADTVFEVASNGASDDALMLAPDGAGATLTLSVSDGTLTVLDATVALDRGLADKSWRNGSGTATWSSGMGTVVDGAICFPDRLSAGVATQGEFTLVMRSADGSYHSVSGGFSLTAAQVLVGAAETITASAVDIDLR